MLSFAGLSTCESQFVPALTGGAIGYRPIGAYALALQALIRFP